MKIKKVFKKLSAGFILGIIVSIIVSLFTTFLFEDLFNKFENFTYDMRYKWQYDPALIPLKELNAHRAIEEVVICDIDERAMLKYGVYHKWPRSYHGDIVRALKKNGAEVVGFDIMFSKADFGKSRADTIVNIVKDLGAKVNNNFKSKIREKVNYDGMFVNEVGKAGNVVAAITLNDSIDYKFTTDWIEKSTQEWRLKNNPLSAAKLPDSIAQFFSPERQEIGSGTLMRGKQVLDGVFPELATAAARVGHVNVEPDHDGVVRNMPLFHNYQGYTYPALSLQMVLCMIGTRLEEIEIVPGEYLNLGKPFKIWKDSTNSLRTSSKGITPYMIERILSLADSIRQLPEGGSIHVSSFLSVSRDTEGKLWMNTISGEIPQEILEVLFSLPKDVFSQLEYDEVTAISNNTAIIAYDDNTFDLKQVDEQGEEIDSWDGIHNEALLSLLNIPVNAIVTLKKDDCLLISSTLNIRKERGSFTSESPVFRKKVISDIISITPEDVEGLADDIKMRFGNDLIVPIDAMGKTLITYRGPARRAFKYISYYDIREERIGANYFQHKAIVIGSSATALFDIVSSPFENSFPGVGIHATLISDFLDNVFTRKLSPLRSWLILIALGMIMSLLAYLFRPVWAGISGILLIIAHFLIAMILFDSHLWIEIIRPIMTVFISFMAVVGYKYVTEEKDRKFLHETFKQYLTPDLIDTMYEKKQMPSLGGEEGIRTAYFTDIQGFSTFSEKLGSPTKLVELLNEYLSAMTNILLEEQGTLDKYEGDAIIAFYGAPMPLEDHAVRACRTALRMLEQLGRLREKWKSEGDKWPEIVHEMQMRIGINSGPIVTGNMGSKVRMNYTMMGDAVNLAARLESGSKQYGSFATCSDETLKLTGDAFVARQLDIMKVLGKTKPVPIYELLGYKDRADEKLTLLVEIFDAGYKAYLAMKWDEAVALFEKALEYEPNYNQPGVRTVPSKALKERCEFYKENPPVKEGEIWDGIYTATSK